MANFSPTAAEIGLPVSGTPANFNGFRVLASLLLILCRRRSTEVNQTLHDVWPSPELISLRYIYIFWGSYPLTQFYPVQNSLCVQVNCVLLLVHIHSVTHGTRVVSVSQTLRRPAISRGCHLYSTGRPSRWASAHILV